MSLGRFIQKRPSIERIRGMHVLIDESALQVVRCIRSQGVSTSLEWFPEVEEPQAQIDLSHKTDLSKQNPFKRSKHSASNVAFTGSMQAQAQETLEDQSFPFASVVSNKWVDVSQIDGSELIDKRSMLHLGVFDINRKAYRKTLRTRLLRRDLPAASFIWAGKHTCFASPELIVIQLASQLSPAKLALIIMELTGYYSLPPNTDSNAKTKTRHASFANLDSLKTVYNLPPVTTIERIRAFAQSVRMVRARAALSAALDMACGHAASPVESIMAIAFALPIDQGGYGMGKPLLNASIRVPEPMRDYLSQQNYYPDIYFPSCKTDLEYESTEFHLDPITANWASDELESWRARQAAKAAADRKRARELESLGVRVIPVVWDDIIRRDSLDRIAWLVYQQVERLHGENASKRMEQLDYYAHRLAREQLLEELMSG